MVWLVGYVSLVFYGTWNAVGDGSLSVEPKPGRLRLVVKSVSGIYYRILSC